jgi:hypothetical protein
MIQFCQCRTENVRFNESLSKSSFWRNLCWVYGVAIVANSSMMPFCKNGKDPKSNLDKPFVKSPKSFGFNGLRLHLGVDGG